MQNWAKATVKLTRQEANKARHLPPKMPTPNNCFLYQQCPKRRQHLWHKCLFQSLLWLKQLPHSNRELLPEEGPLQDPPIIGMSSMLF